MRTSAIFIATCALLFAGSVALTLPGKGLFSFAQGLLSDSPTVEGLEDWWADAQTYGSKAGEVVLGAIVKSLHETKRVVEDFKSAVDHTVEEAKRMRINVQNTIEANNITIDHFIAELSEEIKKVGTELRDDVIDPLPEEHSVKAKARADLIGKVLPKVERAYVQAAVKVGVPKGQAEGQFQEFSPKVRHLLLVTGNIIDNNPLLLEAMIFAATMLLMPEVQILRPIFSVFGFGPLGPVKGTTAAWVQSRFWGGYVKAGSWFAILQKVSMTLTGSWIQRVLASAGLAAVLGFVVNRSSKLCM